MNVISKAELFKENELLKKQLSKMTKLKTDLENKDSIKKYNDLENEYYDNQDLLQEIITANKNIKTKYFNKCDECDQILIKVDKLNEIENNTVLKETIKTFKTDHFNNYKFVYGG